MSGEVASVSQVNSPESSSLEPEVVLITGAEVSQHQVRYTCSLGKLRDSRRSAVAEVRLRALQHRFGEGGFMH